MKMTYSVVIEREGESVSITLTGENHVLNNIIQLLKGYQWQVIVGRTEINPPVIPILREES